MSNIDKNNNSDGNNQKNNNIYGKALRFTDKQNDIAYKVIINKEIKNGKVLYLFKNNLNNSKADYFLVDVKDKK